MLFSVKVQAKLHDGLMSRWNLIDKQSIPITCTCHMPNLCILRPSLMDLLLPHKCWPKPRP